MASRSEKPLISRRLLRNFLQRDQILKEKEKEEKELEKRREKDQIRSGKELQEAKRMAEGTEWKRYKDSRQAEIKEEKKAKEKVLQALEQNK
ncbi:hypothetical protein SDJN02_17713, partial [Cucurbita argyrosperma subsp. argyrosperma]